MSTSHVLVVNPLASTVWVVNEVHAERAKQDAKWGEQNHAPIMWLAILAEEVGEAAQEALKAHFTADMGDAPLYNYRAEMVQVAAVAVAAIESLDRALAAPADPNTETTE